MPKFKVYDDKRGPTGAATFESGAGGIAAYGIARTYARERALEGHYQDDDEATVTVIDEEGMKRCWVMRICVERVVKIRDMEQCDAAD